MSKSWTLPPGATLTQVHDQSMYAQNQGIKHHRLAHPYVGRGGMKRGVSHSTIVEEAVADVWGCNRCRPASVGVVVDTGPTSNTIAAAPYQHHLSNNTNSNISSYQRLMPNIDITG